MVVAGGDVVLTTKVVGGWLFVNKPMWGSYGPFPLVLSGYTWGPQIHVSFDFDGGI